MYDITTATSIPEEVNIDKLAGTKYDLKRDLIGYGEEGLKVQWPKGKKVAISFVLNYEEGGERSLALGDDTSEFYLYTSSKPGPFPNRAYDAETEYDYGSRVGVWRILNLFKKFGNRITAYAVGKAFENNVAVAKAFVNDGHEIASHAYRWIPYDDVSEEVEKAYIIKQIEILKETTGEEAPGWYMGRLSPHSIGLITEVYREQGKKLPYISDFYGDDVPYWVDVPAEADLPDEEKKGLLLVPYSYDCNDFRFLNVNGFRSTQAFYDHLKGAFDTLYEEGGKMMTVGLHCRIIGRPGYFQALKKFVEYVNSHEDVWVCSRSDIANTFKEQYPYKPKK
ncbi:hypothetical protein PSN45_000398 [Yamadazyma tenuis]|uniref:Glycoside hydrolase/deacetylase n=1 Tax=Candida tenuis (strain ATCC 10573 / BCRC 21748 / CBS 615 / JCM 9827 / NBRC 10315 / NRRL Y-1498 / VKM Y-70) TaxID=590646 RepID=G3B880_CANTC|nr:glycoside hydrolase/deacetylase [Yamadazyma tenuis ATCC 10573]XP_006688799.1 uncharacterized protein CANTEDRAFT_115168 [Yamadazyma tenuis ATCC 10573]EGV62628.1 glycoside hydrolase/deacetylase [Yamadazyma tenuis ATCC 10573]EGV62629.1 hypothetical protein CANTEDRAFT_115168 [Yamadazyma tenuis ATCC 10573]WEJ92940.1 hypothetical protein PSN45_000398 [Yamadazyma tenuis]